MRKSHLFLTTFSLCAVTTCFTVPALAQDTTVQDNSQRPIVYPTARIANYQAIPLNDVLLSVDVIEAQEIKQSTATTVSDLIAQKTGIEFSRNGGPGAVTSHFLRGQESKNYIMLIDGVRVHTNAIGSLLMPEISISQIEKIEVLKAMRRPFMARRPLAGSLILSPNQIHCGIAALYRLNMAAMTQLRSAQVFPNILTVLTCHLLAQVLRQKVMMCEQPPSQIRTRMAIATIIMISL